MPRLNSLKQRLPPKVFEDVYAMAQSGRHSVREMVEFAQARGYVISKSAMHRFRQASQGPRDIVQCWLNDNPRQVEILAKLLESGVTIGLGLILHAAGARSR